MSKVKSKNNQKKEHSPLSKYPELNDSELEIVCGGKEGDEGCLNHYNGSRKCDNI